MLRVAHLSVIVLMFACTNAEVAGGVEFPGGWKSGMTFAEALLAETASGGCWTFESGSPRSQREILFVKNREWSHLGVGGSVTLVFAGGRLVRLRFEPSDFDKYTMALEASLGISLRGRELQLVRGATIWLNEEQGQRSAYWLDEALEANLAPSSD